MLEKARDLPGALVWFLTVRVVEVGVLGLLVGGFLEVKTSWAYSSQYSGNGEFPPPGGITVLQRLQGVALFGGYRLPASLVLAAAALAATVVVLHRCQPVRHTRVLRWEWLVVWALTTLGALVSSIVGVLAFVLGDPFGTPTDPNTVSGTAGPGFREQVLGNVSWPLGTLLLLLPLGLWWARLPDMDDLEDALYGREAQRAGTTATDARAGMAPTPGGARPTGLDGVTTGRTGNARPGRPRRGGGGLRGRRDRDEDAILVDEVEQIEPVERLNPRGAERGDGSSSSGYDGYFRRQ